MAIKKKKTCENKNTAINEEITNQKKVKHWQSKVIVRQYVAFLNF